MRKNGIVTVLLCTLIAMAVTVVFYLLAFDSLLAVPMRWLSLTCLLGAELLAAIKAIAARNSILGTTTVIVGFLHLGAVLVISLVFVNLLPMLYPAYLLISLLMLAVVGVIDLLLLYFDRNARQSNQQYHAGAQAVQACLMKARTLELEAGTPEGRRIASGITEALEYSNRSALCGTETEILKKLDALREMLAGEDIQAAESLGEEIRGLLKLRNEMLKKSGSF